MEIIILILAGFFVLAHISTSSARAREKARKEEQRDELVEKMLQDYER